MTEQAQLSVTLRPSTASTLPSSKESTHKHEIQTK